MLKDIKNALTELCSGVHHYKAPDNAVCPYIVWAEDGDADFIADGVHAETAYTGTIDLFTQIEGDPLSRSIPEALDKLPCTWYLNSVQLEEDTGKIHYEWVFGVL